MGFWWKGQWHTVTIPPLLERVPSPRRRTSHLDQWHSSCQDPNVLMSHTSQQFYFKVPPLSLPILHPHPCLFPPSFHPQPFDIHSPLTSRFVIPLTLTFLPVCLSICPVYPSYHASCWPFHLSPQRSVPAWRRATHPGGAAGLVRFMSREDGRLKGPPGISLCHQRLASMLLANVVGVAASPASAAGINAPRKFVHGRVHRHFRHMHTHMVLTSATKNPPYVHLTSACTVSYGYNGGFVLRLRSDSCHRLIPPDLLMGLTTDQAVLEIKESLCPFSP